MRLCRQLFLKTRLFEICLLFLIMIIGAPPPTAPPAAEEELEPEDVATEEPQSLDNTTNNFPAIWSEEGKYLASVLGDALVKGLSLVSQERPHDPVEYLANFLRKYKDDGSMVDGEGKEKQQRMMVAPPVPVPLDMRGVDGEKEEENGKGGDDVEGEEEPGAPEEDTAQEVEDAQETELQDKIAEENPQPIEADEPAEPEAVTPAPSAPTETNLNDQLNEGYDALEEALEEEESITAAPFDPQKDEQAEQELLSSEISPEDQDSAAPAALHNSTRDDNGQSVLHFACTRPGGGSTIMAFLQNPSVNLAWRDVNMRTARDIASNLNRAENMRVIDNWVLSLAQAGDNETLQSLLVDGYDHLADVEDVAGTHIVDVAEGAGNRETALLLRSVPEFRERVERVHRCVRSGDIDGVKSLVGEDRNVALSLSPRTGRNALHVAVLCEEVGIVKWLSENVPESVKRGDNLERTCLHYAMGVDKVEKIVRVLVRAGAKRVVKDLRDRQPSWYFINKDEIGALQAEERAIVN